MPSDPYGNLTHAQRQLVNAALTQAWESHEDLGDILERLDAPEADKRAASDALAGARQ